MLWAIIGVKNHLLLDFKTNIFVLNNKLISENVIDSFLKLLLDYFLYFSKDGISKLKNGICK